MEEPPSEVGLHRLVWDPDDFENGQMKGSSIRRDDLSGAKGHYISVDRIDQFSGDATLATAAQQAAKANGKSVIREKACSALLECKGVREVQDEEGVKPFCVSPEPLTDNIAHCGINNVSGKAARGYINQLRVLICGLVNETLTLDDFITRLE